MLTQCVGVCTRSVVFQGRVGPALSMLCSAGLAWHPHAGAPGQPDTAPILATGSVDMSARLWSASGALPIRTLHLLRDPELHLLSCQHAFQQFTQCFTTFLLITCAANLDPRREMLAQLVSVPCI